MPRRSPDATASRRAAVARDTERKRAEAAAEFYLHDCYGSGAAASASGFARYLRLARPYLSRRFAEVVGMPLGDFLREQQLARAQVLLRTTPATIKEIAAASGFGTEWTFQRCFKAAFGVTPTAYRKQVTKCG